MLAAETNDMTRHKRNLILLVEDNDLDSILIHRVIKRLRPEIEILRRCDGIDALAALERHSPDLIIMDINMPRMGGLEALAEIKRDSQLRRIPVVMMSTSCREVDIDHSYESCANAYVVKSLAANGRRSIEDVVKFWFETAEL